MGARRERGGSGGEVAEEAVWEMKGTVVILYWLCGTSVISLPGTSTKTSKALDLQLIQPEKSIN